MDNLSHELPLLTSNMQLETDGDVECRPVVAGHSLGSIPITEAQMGGGRRVRLLKTLLTSACERNCYYCPFRAGRDYRRATFKPHQMAATFMAVRRAGLAEGLFLSSGVVGGGVRTQDKLLDTADILRNKMGFKGYLHLKIMPGVERDQVVRAMQLASRLSVNLEAPNTKRLQSLAPRKAFTEELLQPLLWVEEIRRSKSPDRTWNGRWPSTVTQFVVGAVGESDLELLATSAKLYRSANLSRAYFSRFNPIVDTPFENRPGEVEIRPTRLYQASFLLRDYGFELEELPFDPHGNLPTGLDPKRAWADRYLAETPLDLNRACRRELMRVPGIGKKSAAAILKGRRLHSLKSLADLRKLGVNASRAAPYILFDGRRPAQQLSFFTSNSFSRSHGTAAVTAHRRMPVKS